MKLILLLVALALVSCEPTRAPYRSPKPERYTKLNESPRPLRARAPASVTLYRAKVPDERFVEVAEMVDIGDDESAALEELKLSASGMGCDGLIIGTARVETVRSTGSQAQATEVNVSGTCIMFVSDPGTWQPAEQQDVCVAGRAKIFAAKGPAERARVARSMPPECHHE